MKRLLLILTIAAAGLVAACSQGSTSTTAPSSGLESVPAVSAPASSPGIDGPERGGAVPVTPGRRAVRGPALSGVGSRPTSRYPST